MQHLREWTNLSVSATLEQPLIGIPFQRDGEDAVLYFADEGAADAAVDQDATGALALIGVWSDLDWAELAGALDRIRHESPPTPPIEL